MAYKNKDIIGEVRPNQMITTFGPGAIIDAVKDSVTILDANYWSTKGERIIDGRLASYLGVSYFYKPKTNSDIGLPIISFPNYHVCSNSKCSRLFDLRESFDLESYKKWGATCPECGWTAYPSRFIVMCNKGHMDDFPWDIWIHGTKTGHKRFKLYSTGSTSTLGDMRVECLECGQKASMSGATQQSRFNGMTCSGRHPFRPHARNENCDEAVIPSQRGASNVYFPVIRSAISIPPWINPLYNLLDEKLRILEDMIAKNVANAEDLLYKLYFEENYSKKEFDEALEKRRKNIKEFMEIKLMEYQAITHHADPLYESNKKHFKAEETAVPADLKKFISRVVRITRLREVMVLKGFTRVMAADPDSDEQVNIVPLTISKTERWLPAVDINGEGVFIEFNAEQISKWLNVPSVKALSNQFESGYDEYCKSRGWNQLYKKNAQYVLLHTFAHLLIKEMSLQSGYSSSAIKERIYSSDEMNGILLYTGSADKEGSLGGLVELGKIGKLISLIKSAFENAINCTNDPECMSNLPSADKVNGAACHSCCMVSETACENGNRMLDRGFIVPLSGREQDAYFRELVKELCNVEV